MVLDNTYVYQIDHVKIDDSCNKQRKHFKMREVISVVMYNTVKRFNWEKFDKL